MSHTSGAVKPTHPRNWTALGAGVFLLAMAAGMVLFATENFMALGIGWFAFLVGLALLMMGALDVQSKKEQPQPQQPVHVVRIRCTHCSSLNVDSSLRCTNCGAKL